MAQEHHSLRRRTVALGAAALLGGCSLLAPRPPPPSYPPPAPQAPVATPPPAAASASPAPNAPATRPPQPPRENHLSPATRSLVTQARTLTARGDLDGASATLDRALRIEPNNPLLWIERGRLRLVQSDAHQAEGCAHKALALASGDHVAQKQAGQLLVDALRAQGRNPEAHEIETQPFMQ